jgi:hypothetical protein
VAYTKYRPRKLRMSNPNNMPDEPYNAVAIAADPKELKLLNRDEKKEMLVLRELMKDMTAFQIRFIEAYIKTASPGMAAKMAGSQSARPEQIGYNLLQEDKIQKAIAIAMKKRIEAVGLDTIEVIQKLREIYDAAMLAGKYDAANKACELLTRQIELAQKFNSETQVAKQSNVGKKAFGPQGSESDLSRVLDVLSKFGSKSPQLSESPDTLPLDKTN